MKELINDEQFERAYRSVGLWFVGMYMEKFLLRLDELENKELKVKFTKEIYDSKNNTFDKGLGGTRIRVNCLHKIIKAGREIEALEQVVNSDRVAKQNPEAINVAKDLLNRIKNGTFKY
ncbi:hypothetical protein [Clostridioides sp. GD02404]|uniref:hypothetical protein n=1 Tax=Clostridioides sp. GD02404 TaxID=3054354 RepID=UPI0038A9FBFF